MRMTFSINFTGDVPRFVEGMTTEQFDAKKEEFEKAVYETLEDDVFSGFENGQGTVDVTLQGEEKTMYKANVDVYYLEHLLRYARFEAIFDEDEKEEFERLSPEEKMSMIADLGGIEYYVLNPSETEGFDVDSIAIEKL